MKSIVKMLTKLDKRAVAIAIVLVCLVVLKYVHHRMPSLMKNSGSLAAEDVKSKLDALVSQRGKIQMFSKDSCPYCVRQQVALDKVDPNWKDSIVDYSNNIPSDVQGVPHFRWGDDNHSGSLFVDTENGNFEWLGEGAFA